jgi:predicted PurR-regulated permease PerM
MPTNRQRRTIFWLALLVGLAVSLHLLSPILPPFVLGITIAYLVDPIVARLERLGLSRTVATAAIVLGAFAVASLALLLLVPVLVEQLRGFVERLPDLIAWARRGLLPVANRLTEKLGGEVSALPAPPTAAILQRAGSFGGEVVRRVLVGSLGAVSLLSLLALTPLVTFYLLRDWPQILGEIDDWLPRQHAGVIREQLRKIDAVLMGFAKGVAVVCFIQAGFYAIALTLVGLDFGMIIGLTAGLISFVPYLGAIFGIGSAVSIALYQFWPEWPHVALVAAVFVTGQLVQDYVLTPRLIGDQIGLHPLWVIFGVLAGGALFGFVGILLAVPACAVIGVLLRFGLTQYKLSSLYVGDGD